jgi:hypothetical protein
VRPSKEISDVVIEGAAGAGLRKSNFDGTKKTNIQLGARNAEFVSPRNERTIRDRDVVAR